MTWIAALGLLACPGEVELESIESTLFANGCTQEPVLTVLSPSAGETFQASIPVILEISAFTLADKLGDEPQACEGHLHVFVDNRLSGMVSQPEFEVDLTDFDPPLLPGEHTLRIAVHTNRHEPILEIEPRTITFMKE
jgi:hypothetical protein